MMGKFSTGDFRELKMRTTLVTFTSTTSLVPGPSVVRGAANFFVVVLLVRVGVCARGDLPYLGKNKFYMTGCKKVCLSTTTAVARGSSTLDSTPPVEPPSALAFTAGSSTFLTFVRPPC